MKRIIFSLNALFVATFAFSSSPTLEIKIDQVGYERGAVKIALVVSQKAETDFAVHQANDNSVAYKGKLSVPIDDPDSGDRVQTADFSALDKDGTYYLEVPGVGRSWDFSIGQDVYLRAYYLAMRAFYGQRCGTAVDLGNTYPGYKHAACHLTGAYHSSSGKGGSRSSIGGWHDAGDYGRYIVNSGISTGTLMWTWEVFGPRIRGVKLNLPETGNGTPDILNETRWNLDWMLSMQDEDGGVWQKQTSERFPNFVMPEDDTTVSYVVGTGAPPYKSTGATADFAAVMAIAGRVYKPFDSAFARKCEDAARSAWMWLEKNSDVQFRNPPGVSTGEYGDRDCADELLWAAAELWRTSGDETYQRFFLAHYSGYLRSIRPNSPPSWSNVAPLALWTYVLGHGKDAAVADAIRQVSLSAADEIVARSARSGYRISLATADFVWGSNGVNANYGMQLLVANAFRPDRRYIETAMENLHYLLGRNTFSLCWVTRLGENPFRHPHHRPSGADNNAEPWPGLLSGGPNHSRQDSAMKKLPDLPPAKMYLDEQASYATNEVAINWNAPLVFLLAGLLSEK